MKIAVLSSHTPSLFWFRMDMMQEFLRQGHKVVAVGNEKEAEWKDSFRKKKIDYRQAEISRNGTNPLQDLKTFRSLKKILKEEMPDKIFTYQAKTIIYGACAAQQLKIDEVYPLIAGIGSVFLSDSLKTRIIRTIVKLEYKFAMKRCPRYFFQNPDDVKIFRKLGIIDPDRVVLLHGSGVNLDTFSLQPLPDEPVFLCVSRLIRDKGIYEYLEAARRVKKEYPKARFLLVGPYDSNPSAITPAELKPYIDQNIIEYFGEQNDVRPYLAQCCVFVLPSYREGTPKSVLEAMACGRAILTSDAPGCRETVVNGKNGYLIPVQDIEGLFRKICEMIESPSLVKKMAEESRKMAEEKFDVRLVNQKILQTMKL